MSRFDWEDGDLVPVGGEPASPEWPSDTKRLSEMADWVEDQLPLAAERWSDEVLQLGPKDDHDRSPMRRSEQAALLGAFRDATHERWEPVLRILEAGSSSRRFQSVVALLIRHGGFHSRATLASYEETTTFREKRLIERILGEHYPDRSEKARIGLATKLMAILLRPSEPLVGGQSRAESDGRLVHDQTADVQEAVKHRKEKRNRDLDLVCWRVATDPVSAD